MTNESADHCAYSDVLPASMNVEPGEYEVPNPLAWVFQFNKV